MELLLLVVVVGGGWGGKYLMKIWISALKSNLGVKCSVNFISFNI